MYDKNKTKQNNVHFDVLFDYERRAEAAKSADRALKRRFDRGSNAYIKAVKRFRAALRAAYPPGFWEDYDRLRHRNPTGLPIAIEFLEADPWFHRSGYIKEKLIRYIIRFNLSENYSARLQKVVLAVVDKGDRREFRDYCRLARKVDHPNLRRGLLQRTQQNSSDVRRRAQWVLDALEKGVSRKGKWRAQHVAHRKEFPSEAFLAYLANLRLGKPEYLEFAVELLERSGMFGHDGREKGMLISALAEIDPPETYRPFLEGIILSAVDTWYVYGFDRYCALAIKLDRPDFRSELTKRLEHADYHVRRRAQLVLEALSSVKD